MRLRKLALAVGLAGTLGANLASALGLGEITLNSTLNQPLDAHIRLLQVRDLSAEEVLVNLASREDFTRAGVDRFFFLTDLTFSVDLDNSAGPVVVITSSKPVREPYLNFLVESQWPSGRLLREYTLLMDLPSFSDQAVRPVEGAKASSPIARKTQAQARTQTRAPAPRRESQRARYDDDVYGPVSGTDTLWEIALKVRPSASTSVQQTMLAIQRQNPEAFINGNINLLKRGSVLRVPSADQITDISRRQALSEVAQQNNSWSGDSDSNSDLGAQLDGASRDNASRREVPKGQGRVKLVSSNSGSSLGGSQGASGDADALENELAISLEELDKSKRENSELNSRVAELEAQLGTMERLVNVSNTELKTLQLALKQRREEADAAADKDKTIAADTSASEQTAVSEGGDIAASATESSTPDPLAAAVDSSAAAEETKTAKAVKPKASVKRVISKPKEPGLVDMIMDNILLVAAGLFAIIAAIVLILRRKDEEPAEEDLEDFDDDQLFGEASADEVEAEEESDEEISLDQADEEDIESAEEAIQAETNDVVGEADIYIAYGKFDQAEEMLSNYLESDLGNTAARLKLMEVYAETNNLDAFDAQYRQVLNLDDELAAERAKELRASFSGAAAFDSEFVSTIDANDMELSEDFETSELELESDEEPSIDLVIDAEDDEQESDVEENEVEGIDFDLDLDLEPETETETETEAETDEGLGLSEGIAAGAGLALAGELLAEEPNSDEENTDESNIDDLNADETEGALEFEGLDLADLDIAEDQGEEDDFTLDLDLSEELSDLSDAEELTLELDDLDAPEQDTALDFELDELELELEGEGESEAEPEVEAESEVEPEFDAEELSDEAINFALDTDLDLDISEDDSPSESLALVDEEEDDFDMGDLDLDLDALDAEIEELSSEEVEALDSSFDELSLDDDEGLADSSLDDAVEELAALDSDIEALESEVFAAELDAESDSESLEDASHDLELEAKDTDVKDIEAEVFDALPDVEDNGVFDLSADADVSEAGDEDLDGELDFLADADEVTTKLDLARAYIDMGDAEGAKDILDEVIEEGNEQQRSDAEGLLAKL